MDSPCLLSLPTELLHYLSLFLPEEDLLSLFQTCLQVHKALNTNLVWKRFVTEEVRRLETREQQLDPPLQLDPNLCEDLQHVLRKKHLLNNWRNGRFSQHASNHDTEELTKPTFYNQYQTEFYRENYLIIWVSDQADIWDIRKNPNICRKMKGSKDECRVIGDYAVFVKGCRVSVNRINIEGNLFTPLYSFIVDGDDIAKDNVSHPTGPCCDQWVVSHGDKFLAFSRGFIKSHTDKTYMHVWDVVNGRKLGSFVLPEFCMLVIGEIIYNNNCLFFKVMSFDNFIYILKLDITAKRFSDAAFKNGRFLEAIVHNDHCIVMNRPDDVGEEYVRIEVFNFNTSEKITERRFENTCYNFQRRTPVDGKLVIFTSECFHVVYALTLETVTVVPHDPAVHFIMCQTSVFGAIFLVTVDRDGFMKIWDIDEKKSSTVIPQTQQSEEMISRITWKYCGILHGKEPLTKFVICGTNMVVINFW